MNGCHPSWTAGMISKTWSYMILGPDVPIVAMRRPGGTAESCRNVAEGESWATINAQPDTLREAKLNGCSKGCARLGPLLNTLQLYM